MLCKKGQAKSTKNNHAISGKSGRRMTGRRVEVHNIRLLQYPIRWVSHDIVFNCSELCTSNCIFIIYLKMIFAVKKILFNNIFVLLTLFVFNIICFSQENGPRQLSETRHPFKTWKNEIRQS